MSAASLFKDISQTAQKAEGDLQNVQREIKILEQSMLRSELVLNQIDSSKTSAETNPNLYRSVGKLFWKQDADEVRQSLKDQNSSFRSSIEKLKQRKNYLDTTIKNAREHLERIGASQ